MNLALITSFTSFFGPFGQANTTGKFRVNASNQLIVPFSFPVSGGYETSIWTYNSSGSALVNVQSFGPF